ncbi:nuclear transport factor 2 family protein [Brevundimonas aurifodinae]|uniref:Nuclear transport factor 2 family protein n=1 Tax=Brevundimonas aurifodinae TaxID=1508312 RepID=A0ABV1NQ57_9CAUL
MLIPLIAALALQSAPVSAEAEVAAVLDQLNAASSAADGNAYFALFTPDARFVGTDATEHWTIDELRAYAAGAFGSEGGGWSYPATERAITIASIECRCIAWFEEELVNESYGRTRGSGVMRLTDGGWKIEQYVLSLAVPNDLASPIARIIKAYETAKEAPLAGTTAP